RARKCKCILWPSAALNKNTSEAPIQGQRSCRPHRYDRVDIVQPGQILKKDSHRKSCETPQPGRTQSRTLLREESFDLVPRRRKGAGQTEDGCCAALQGPTPR